MNFKKMRKYLLKGGIFFFVAAGALVATYALTPNRKRTIQNGDSPTNIIDEPATYFNKFVTKLTSSLDGDGELGLSASLKGFEVTWPTKDGLAMNDIKLNGDLNILMRSIDDLDFTLDVNANYNGKTVDAALGLVQSDFYFALQDFRIKSSYNSTVDALTYIYDMFFNPENPDGLGIDLNIESVVGDAVGGIDLNSLLSSFSGVSLPKTTEKEVGDNVVIDLSMEDMGMNINIVVNKETLALVSVDLGTIKVGDVTIKGALECDTITQVLKLDDPSYPHQRGQFVEIISYIPWVDDILDLLKTRKIGLDFDAQITLVDGVSTVTLADLATSINLDASQLIDFGNIIIGHDDPDVGRPEAYRNSETDDDSIDEILETVGKLEFGVDLSAKGQSAEEYTNANIAYFDNAGYLALNENAANEAVLRAKIDNATISNLAKKVPDLIASLGDDVLGSSALISKAATENTTESLFSFLTSSPLMNAINNGDYSGIVGILKEITNDENGISLTLDLSSLGLGENAEVTLDLDASDNRTAVVAIDVNDVTIGNAVLDAQVKTDEYSDSKINYVKENKELYDDMSFVPGVIGQVSNILDTKRAQLQLEGSVLDINNEGIALNGTAQFDYGEKIGYGAINIRQYDSTLVNSNKYVDHTVKFDVDNHGNELTEKNMHFVYNENLKAKITIQTVADIIELFTELLDNKDERFTKFLDPLMETVLSGTIGNIISSKDYLELAKSSVLKSLKQTNGGNTLEVVIAKDVFGLESDIVLRLNLKTVNEEKQIDSLELVNFVMSGKAINIKLTIADYADSYVSPVNKADTFMDFSQVKILLDFGINTTKLNYYHLSAEVTLKVSVLKALDFKLDFHIYVDGKHTKVYGSIPDVPCFSVLISNDLLSTKVNSEFVFEPTEDIGGLFHMVRNEDHLLDKDEVNYYQSTSDNFLENILIYLLVDLLNVRSTAVDGLTNLTLDTEKDFDPDYSQMFMENGFSYSKDASTGINTWNIGLNMNQLLGNNSLQTLNVTLNGIDDVKSGFFSTAHIEMKMVNVVTVLADLKLENPSFSIKTWPSDIEAKYNKVLNWYYGMSQSNIDRFDAEYKNQPLKTWRVVEERNYF